VEAVGYDPLEVAKAVEPQVYLESKGVSKRKYFRFRIDRWYGGIVTGDVIGCNMRCKFCWAWYFTWGDTGKGRFYTAEEVVRTLESLSRKSGYRRARLSGGEPTIGFKHMLEVMDLAVSKGLQFVLETNGILIGHSKSIAERLGAFSGRGIEVRVSVKGTSPEEFHELTGADPRFWFVQLDSLRNLVEAGLEPAREVYPAVMLSLSGEEGLRRFSSVVKGIHEELSELIDEEYIILYRHVKELLMRTGLRPKYVILPDRVPDKMI
jgi:uncharacterized Fe-S cluster-containing radical SAM superfamily protein